MTLDQAIEHFGGLDQALHAAGIPGATRQTVHNWRRKGIPEDTQWRLEYLSNGHLRVDDKFRNTVVGQAA